MSEATAAVDLVTLLKQLRDEEAQYDRQLTAVRQEISMVEQVLAIAQRRSDIGVTLAAPPSIPTVSVKPPVQPIHSPAVAIHTYSNATTSRTKDLARKVRGLTQIEALRRIAQQSGGIVRTIELKPIFIEAKLSKGNPRNVGSHLYHLLNGAEEFEKVEAGTFRWLPYVAPAEGRQATDTTYLPLQVQLGVDRGPEGEMAARHPEVPRGGAQETSPPERDEHGYHHDRVGMVQAG